MGVGWGSPAAWRGSVVIADHLFIDCLALQSKDEGRRASILWPLGRVYEVANPQMLDGESVPKKTEGIAAGPQVQGEVTGEEGKRRKLWLGQKKFWLPDAVLHLRATKRVCCILFFTTDMARWLCLLRVRGSTRIAFWRTRMVIKWFLVENHIMTYLAFLLKNQ